MHIVFFRFDEFGTHNMKSIGLQKVMPGYLDCVHRLTSNNIGTFFKI